MLSYEFMGVLALWVLWVNSALIAGAALMDLRRLRRPYAGFRRLPAGAAGLGVVRGVVEASAPLARLCIHRTGRLADGRTSTIQFGAQAPRSELLGGVVRVESTPLAVSAGPGRVWLDPRAIEASLERHTDAEFLEAEAEARRRKGYQRTTRLEVEGGQVVFVAGRFVRSPAPEAWRVEGSEEAPVLISSVDPTRFVAVQTARTAAFLLGMFAVLAAITALALSEPRLGPLAKLGGVLGLAYFLLVLPAASRLRERTRAPDLRGYFGLWRSARPHPLASASLEHG